MAQTISHEAKAPVKKNPGKADDAPSKARLATLLACSYEQKEALGTVCGTIYSSASVFRFLAETFGALDAGGVDLKPSSDAAGGIAHICKKEADALFDAYGLL